MPYVACAGCGTRSYAARPHALAADCPVCGTGLVDPRLVARPVLRPSLPQRPDDYVRGRRPDQGALPRR
jgi:hypothetical protein